MVRRRRMAPPGEALLPTGVDGRSLVPKRYDLVRELGRGATSRVFLVRDRRSGELQALKRLEPTADAVRLRLFEEEYRVLRSVAPHPHVVEPIEFGRDPGPHFTLEYLPGRDLGAAATELLASGGKQRLGPRATGELVRWIRHLLSALGHLHGRGLRHCDLKPENVLVTDEGAKLLDLGLAAPVAGASAGGTLAYLAPEVLRGEPSDQRADLFALGVTLYRVLTGALPWGQQPDDLSGGGRVQGDVAQRLLARTPPSVREVEPRVPKFLDELIARLLAPRPEDRFPSAGRALGQLARRPGAAGVAPCGPSAWAALAPGFFGREVHLQEAAARAGRCGTVVVTGPAGFGKTAFLRELEAALQLTGRRALLAGRPDQGGSPGPYAALLGAAGEVAGPGEAPTERSPGGLRDRRARNAARVGATLARLGDGRTVLILDDVHRLDADAAAPLADLLAQRRCGVEAARSVGLVLALRPGELRATALAAEVARLPGPAALDLGPLPEADVERLAASIASGADASAAARDALAGWVAGRSHGDPRFAVELTRAALGAGVLDDPTGVAARLASLSLPAGAEEAACGRIDALGRPARDLLELLAVLGEPAPLDLLLARARNAGRGLAALRELERSHLVTRRADGARVLVVVAHEGLRETVYRRLRARRRRPLHDRAAALLAPSGEGPAVLEHRLRGDAPADALDDALTAARSCEAEGAFARARTLLSAALDVLTAEDPRRRCALIDAAKYQELAGDPAAARMHLGEALALSEPGALRAEVLLAQAHLAESPGEGAALCERALAEASDASPDLLAELYSYLGWRALAAGDRARAQELCDAGCERAAEAGPVGRSRLLLLAGELRQRAGDLVGARAQLAEAAGLVRERRPRLAPYYLAAWADVERLAGNRARAAALLDEGVDLARRLQLPREVAVALARRAGLAGKEGRLGDSVADRREALVHFARAGDPPEAWSNLCNLGYALTSTGALGEALALLREALARADTRIQRVMALHALAGATFAAGAAGEAQALLRRAREEAGEPDDDFRLEEARLRALEAAHRRDDAALRALAQEVIELAGDRPNRRGEALEARLLAALAELGRDQARAEHLGAALAAQAAGHPVVVPAAEAVVALAREDPAGVRQAAERLEAAGDRGHLAWCLLAEAELLERRGAADAFRRPLALVRALASTLSGEDEATFLSRPDAARALARAAEPAPTPLAPGDPGALLGRVLAVNAALASRRTARAVLAVLLDEAIGLVGAERGFVLLRTPRGLRVMAHRNLDREALRDPAFKYSRSIAASVCQEGRAVLTDDAQRDRRFRSLSSVRRLEVASVVCAPLRDGDEAIGALYLDNRLRRGAFLPRDLAALTAFADQAAIALRNARVLEELEAARRETQRLNRALERALASEQRQHARTRARLRRAEDQLRFDYLEIAGRGAGMSEVLAQVDRFTDQDEPVVIYGETGTGKELVAQALHRNGPRRAAPFQAINCAALPAPLVESELFGHVQGAFTGATSDREGILVAAGAGTVFLDEVGELQLPAQASLLRALQEREVRPVGGRRTVPLRARVVAATHRDLRAEVAAGRFRQDLFFRLDVLSVRLPSLRERLEDLPDVAAHLLARIRERPPGLSGAALRQLQAYDWPGNVRELESELRRAVIFAPGPTIEVEHLSPRLQGVDPAGAACALGPETLRQAVAAAERRVFDAALRQASGNQSAAARLLGLSRYGFYKASRRLGLDVGRG